MNRRLHALFNLFIRVSQQARAKLCWLQREQYFTNAGLAPAPTQATNSHWRMYVFWRSDFSGQRREHKHNRTDTARHSNPNPQPTQSQNAVRARGALGQFIVRNGWGHDLKIPQWCEKRSSLFVIVTGSNHYVNFASQCWNHDVMLISSFLHRVHNKALVLTLRGKIHLMLQMLFAKKEQTLFTG